MSDDQLINKKFHILQRNKLLRDNEKFIYNEIGNRINQSLENINFSINNCLEIGFSSKIIYKYILSRFNKVNYSAIDISNKILERDLEIKQLICIDHDKWKIDKKKFDLIISNFYLHLSNNLDLLFQNIKQSLNQNGFFIAALPGINCFHEIKNSMIKADIEMYGGAYRRFMELFSVDQITNILKKYGYSIPVIEVDTLELRYKKFSSLLNDIRYIGNSNIYYDRKKKFEKKKYFNKVEEIYWKQYSNKKKLILQLEIIYITAWKNDI